MRTCSSSNVPSASSGVSIIVSFLRTDEIIACAIERRVGYNCCVRSGT